MLSNNIARSIDNVSNNKGKMLQAQGFASFDASTKDQSVTTEKKMNDNDIIMDEQIMEA